MPDLTHLSFSLLLAWRTTETANRSSKVVSLFRTQKIEGIALLRIATDFCHALLWFPNFIGWTVRMYLMVHNRAYIFDCITDSGQWACFSLCMDNEHIFECAIPSCVYCMGFEHGRIHTVRISICGRI